MKYQWALVGLLIATTCSTAAVLSLQECIDLAMQNNLQHQIDQQTLANSQAQLTMARAPFAFSMGAIVTAPSFTEERDTREADIALTTRVREEQTNVSYLGNLRMDPAFASPRSIYADHYGPAQRLLVQSQRRAAETPDMTPTQSTSSTIRVRRALLTSAIY